MINSKNDELKELIIDVEKLILEWDLKISNNQKVEMLDCFFNKMMCLRKRYINLQIADFGEKLTLREMQIVCLIHQGKTTKEMSLILNISPNTIETHRSNIFYKLDVRNMQELILVAIKRGFVD